MNSGDKISFITESDFESLLYNLSQGSTVYIPGTVLDREGNEVYSYQFRSPDIRFEYTGFRPTNPLKTFLFKGREKVADYPSGEVDSQIPDVGNVTIVGAASCDIESLKSLDAIFLQDEFTDIFYSERRKKTLIITEDCTEPRETCFCTLAGHGPHPESGFDLNLSRIEGGYLVEAGTEKGEEVISQNNSLFSSVQENQLKARQEARDTATQRVNDLNRDYTISKSRHDVVKTCRDSDHWYEDVSTCVECGACLFSCPTCHCFILYDQEGSLRKFERIKEWDVCIYSGYARMAGGGTPRPGLMERFRHRFLHKLEYFPENFNIEACTGCGRCIEGCPGKIDMRKVLKALDREMVETG